MILPVVFYCSVRDKARFFDIVPVDMLFNKRTAKILLSIYEDEMNHGWQAPLNCIHIVKY
jgi:hypothetical protein